MKKDQFSKLVILLLVLASNSFLEAHGQSGREILEQTGVKGGLIVHIDCGDGQLTAALRDNERYIVHGLDTNTKNIKTARRYIQSLGLYGPVSVQPWNGLALPYADNLASLVVVDKPNRVSMNEVMRVLRPLGVAYVKSGGKWIKTTKPWPDEIDEWTHWQHSADGNAVARDKVVDSPRRIQWVANPVWQRHHNLVPSTSAMVSSRGRMFIIEDEAQTSANAGELPDNWYLVARDAFSGVLLWKRPIKEWGWKTWNTAWEGRFNQPPQLPKRLVAAGDRVYVTLGFSAPVSEIDAATGKVLRVLKGTERTDEIIHQDGKLVLSIGHEAPKPSEDRKEAVRRNVCVIDLESGKKLWDKGAYSGLQAKTDGASPFGRLELVAGKKQVFLMDQSAIVSLDLGTGRQNWQIARPKAKEYLITSYFIRYSDQCVLVYQDGVVLLAQPTWEPKRGWHSFPGTLYAFSAVDGKLLWKYPYGGWSHNWQPDVFVVDGKVWIHEHTIVEDNDWRTGHRLDKSNIDYFLIGLDLQTGKIKRRFSTNKTLQTDHHHRCYRAKATERFFIASRRGAEFINYETGHNSLNHWARGACLHGFVPCNGMLYLTPHPCICYLNTKLNGYYALAPKSERAASAQTTDIAAFELGPAYEQADAGKSATANANDWPTFRHDPSRSGSTRASVPHSLKLCWEAAVGGKLTPPVVAGGKVFVASIDEHRVVALTESNGRQVWDFTAGGRVDTPPTIYKGLVLFGSADGWAYCLRESDGQLVWRRRLAPEARLIGARDQLESAWPIHGSILVKDNIAYVAAGRSSYLDSGIFLYELDPVTGTILKKRILYSPDPETDEMIPPDIFVDRKTLQGTKSDILVSAGSGIFMRAERVFGDDTNPMPYLFAGGGFRDENWFNRVSWEIAPVGKSQLLVFTDQRAYGVRAYLSKGPAKSFQRGNKGHGLWAGELNLAPLSQPDSKNKVKELWSENVSVRFNALAAAGEILFAAGAIDTIDPSDPLAPFEGRADSKLWAVNGKDGRKLSEYYLEGSPIYDGMAVAEGRVFVAMKTGKVLCFASTEEMRDVTQIEETSESPGHTRTYVISDPQDIEDVALRDREFADWNFGGGIVLEAGYMPGLYEEHHCVSLLRFDLSRLLCEKVQAAKVRLYKPKCTVQMRSAKIGIYQLTSANTDWTEGTSLCEEEAAASCWSHLRKEKTWAGAKGCSRKGVDFLTPVLDIQTAPDDCGQWLEFDIPIELVQRWLDHPEQNSGLYIKPMNEKMEWGDHVYFYSSEHSSGKGPQLVIEGTPGKPKIKTEKQVRKKRKHMFPPSDTVFDKWLAEADNRYVRWTKECNMTREQAKIIYYYDVTVRGEMLMPNCRVPLTEYIVRLDTLIPKGDEKAARDILKNVRKRLLYWEYIREANWYDAGPLADVLTPLQLGTLWGKCIFGNMLKKHGNSSWKRLSPDELETEIESTVKKTRERLELTTEQAKIIDPLVAKYERLEHEYVENFMDDLMKIQEFIKQGRDDEAMFNLVKSLHMNHELFLYFQSWYNTPRWSLYMEQAAPIPLAKIFANGRRKEYNPERTQRQIDHAKKY